MKQLIARIRKANRRRITVLAAVVAGFYALNWGFAQLMGVVIESNPHNYSLSDATVVGYFTGFVLSFTVLDLARRADKALTDRFAKNTADATQ